MTTLKDFIEALKSKNTDKFFELLDNYIYINRLQVQAIDYQHGYIIIYMTTIVVTVMEFDNKIIVQVHYMIK